MSQCNFLALGDTGYDGPCTCPNSETVICVSFRENIEHRTQARSRILVSRLGPGSVANAVSRGTTPASPKLFITDWVTARVSLWSLQPHLPLILRLPSNVLFDRFPPVDASPLVARFGRPVVSPAGLSPDVDVRFVAVASATHAIKQ